MRFDIKSGVAVIKKVSGDPPYTIGVVPGSGVTLTIEYGVDDIYFPWPAGATTTAATLAVFTGPLDTIRVTRTVGSADSSVVIR